MVRIEAWENELLSSNQMSSLTNDDFYNEKFESLPLNTALVRLEYLRDSPPNDSKRDILAELTGIESTLNVIDNDINRTGRNRNSLNYLDRLNNLKNELFNKKQKLTLQLNQQKRDNNR